jgi:hypothetical protein
MARPKKERSEDMTASEASDPQATPESGDSAKKPSKTEMVRQAIEKGRKRKPIAIQEWVQKTYGEEIPTQHISTIKSNLRKGAGRKPRKGGDGDGAPAPSRKKSSESDSLSLEEIRIVRALIGRIGPSRFQQVVELLT